MVKGVVKGLFLLLLVVGLVVGVTIGLPMFRETFTSIAVVAVNLSPGMQIGDGMVAMRMWRRDQVPEGAVFSLEGIMGKYASERVYKDQPIFSRQITDIVPPPPHPCLQGRVTPQGYVAIPFHAPASDTIGLFVGDRVDIVVQFVDMSQTPIVVKDPVTLRVGWRVHYIDYASPTWERQGVVPVYLKMSTVELDAQWALGTRRFGTTRLLRSDR